MSVLSRLTPGATFKDPREGKSTGEAELTLAEIGMAVGQLDWFAYALVMKQHCDQEPDRINRVIGQIQAMIVQQWVKGKGRPSMQRGKLKAMAECLWHDFATNMRMTDVERATLCGLSDRGYRSGPHEIYREVLAEMNSVAADGFRTVKRQLAN